MALSNWPRRGSDVRLADAASVSIEERKNMYSQLGAYRGLSETLADVTKQVSPIDWARLREARF